MYKPDRRDFYNSIEFKKIENQKRSGVDMDLRVIQNNRYYVFSLIETLFAFSSVPSDSKSGFLAINGKIEGS